jgi:hypothetical protein
MSSQNWHEMSMGTSLNDPTNNGRTVNNYTTFSTDENFGFGTPTMENPHATVPSMVQSYKDSLLNFYAKNELVISTSLLVVSTAGERVTFKFMIDHMYPFKFVLIEIIFLLSFLLFSIVTLYKTHRTKEITKEMRSFPHQQIMIMAFLDSIQFLGLVLSGVYVSPTMTVILMHTSTLFVVGGSRIAFPHRNYGDLHKNGLIFISFALFISLCKIVWCDWSSADSEHYLSTRSALLYIFSAALQGLSTLYKENSLVSWGQPVNIYYLTSFLFLYQFITMFVMSLLFYFSRGNNLFPFFLSQYFLTPLFSLFSSNRSLWDSYQYLIPYLLRLEMFPGNHSRVR